MGSLKVNITCGGDNMEVQQLQIEPDNWHHRFEVSVVSKMVNNKNIIRIEMIEVTQKAIQTDHLSATNPLNINTPPLQKKESQPAETDATRPNPPSIFSLNPNQSKQETDHDTDPIDGSVWL